MRRSFPDPAIEERREKRSFAWSVAEHRPPRVAGEDRPADRRREDVVEIEVQLADHADAAAAGAVDRYDRLDAELEVLAGPQDARIDGTGRAEPRVECIANRCLELGFYDGDQAVDEVWQPQVDDVRLEIRHAVLHGAAVDEKLRTAFDVERLLAGIRIDLAGDELGRTARYRIADLAGQREWSRPAHRIWEIAQALADEQRRRDRTEALGAHPLGAAIAPFDRERRRQHQFLRGIREELVFERGLQILEPAGIGAAWQA